MLSGLRKSVAKWARRVLFFPPNSKLKVGWKGICGCIQGKFQKFRREGPDKAGPRLVIQNVRDPFVKLALDSESLEMVKALLVLLLAEFDLNLVFV